MGRPRKRELKDRLYQKNGEGKGWYCDFRIYEEAGGGKEALKAPGCNAAEPSFDLAYGLAKEREKELQDILAGRLRRAADEVSLRDYAEEHLALKYKLGARESTVSRDEQSLGIILRWYTATHAREPALRDITPKVAERFVIDRLASGRAAQTVLNDLHALSNLFDGAETDGLVTDYPAIMKRLSKRCRRALKARGPRKPTSLEGTEGAAVLAAAGEVDRAPGPRGFRFTQALLATFLLTGGRYGEVTGLAVGDVDLDRGLIRFRPNRWRKLKTEESERAVPVWPQLDPILRGHLAAQCQGFGPDDLVFPSPNGGLLKDIRGTLRRVERLAGSDTHLTPHLFRHTYTSMRLRTAEETRLPNGQLVWQAVSAWDVATELGHTSVALIEKVYGHKLKDPSRTVVVEYKGTPVLELRPGEGRHAAVAGGGA